jgi:hypothetical protein
MENHSRFWELRSSSGSITIISAIIYTGYEVITNVVSLHISESGFINSEVVRGMKSARGFKSTESKFVRHLGRIGFYVSFVD